MHRWRMPRWQIQRSLFRHQYDGHFKTDTIYSCSSGSRASREVYGTAAILALQIVLHSNGGCFGAIIHLKYLFKHHTGLTAVEFARPFLSGMVGSEYRHFFIKY